MAVQKSIRGTVLSGTRYFGPTNFLKYTQEAQYVDDAYTESYLTLGHELYHAYQDDRNEKRTESGAMRFENYLRDVFKDVFRSATHRTKHGGVQMLNPGNTALLTDGERVDINSVKLVTSIFGGSKEGGSGEGSPRDNVNDGTSIKPIVNEILEYMGNSGIERFTIRLDQRNKKKNNDDKRP